MNEEYFQANFKLYHLIPIGVENQLKILIW